MNISKKKKKRKAKINIKWLLLEKKKLEGAWGEGGKGRDNVFRNKPCQMICLSVPQKQTRDEDLRAGFSKEALLGEIGGVGEAGSDSGRPCCRQGCWTLLSRRSGWGPGAPTGPQVEEARAAPGHASTGEGPGCQSPESWPQKCKRTWLVAFR